MSLTALVFVGVAAVAGGALNAVAGGGTLLTFPALLAAGVPAVSANVTNTVALSPGYLGGTLAQRSDLEGQGPRLAVLLPVGLLGGLAGAVLLLSTSEAAFRSLIPFLILLATGLLAVQPRVKRWLALRAERRVRGPQGPWAAAPPTLVASVYGGYFGAGLGIVLLAALGSVLEDDLTRVNALKQAISFVVNVTAALFFVFSGRVVWSAALVMAVGSLAGGVLGGRFVSRLHPDVLRRTVVGIGLVLSVVYLVR